MPLRALVAFAAALLAASPLASASAQEWPARPVKIVVGFAPGSSADQLARLVGQELSTAFKQQFYVEYRQGNSGGIAASDTARATPDGYTLIGGSGPHITVPALNPKIGYDPMKDFTHIAMIAATAMCLPPILRSASAISPDWSPSPRRTRRRSPLPRRDPDRSAKS